MEKQYLDYEGFEHTIERLRRKEMPEPGLDYVGQIVQYVGGTSADYVKGNFYECVSETEEGVTTYRWEVKETGSISFYEKAIGYGYRHNEERELYQSLMDSVGNFANNMLGEVIGAKYEIGPANNSMKWVNDSLMYDESTNCLYWGGPDPSTPDTKDKVAICKLDLSTKEITSNTLNLPKATWSDTSDTVVRDIAAYGNYLYLAVRSGGTSRPSAGTDLLGGLVCVDKSDLSVVWTEKMDARCCGVNIYEATNGIVYLMLNGRMEYFRLYTVDKSDPTTITLVETRYFRTYPPEIPSGSIKESDVDEQQKGCFYETDNGNVLYIGAGFGDGLRVWDVTDAPTTGHVTLAGNFQFKLHRDILPNDTYHTQDCVVDYPFVYATLGPSSTVARSDYNNGTNNRRMGLLTLNISDLSNITGSVQHISIDDMCDYMLSGDPKPKKILMREDKLFLANGNKGIAIYDISTSGRPIYLGTKFLTEINDVDGMAIAGNKLYAGDCGIVRLGKSDLVYLTPKYIKEYEIYKDYKGIFAGGGDTPEPTDDVYGALIDLDIMEDLSTYDSTTSVNVKDLGAVGDGVTDDSAAFVSALYEASAHGKVNILIPHGIYDLNNVAMEVPSGVSLIGENAHNTVLLNNNWSAPNGMTAKNLAFEGGTNRAIANMTWQPTAIIDASPSADTAAHHYENCIFKGISGSITHYASVASQERQGMDYDGTTYHKIASDEIINCIFEDLRYSGIHHCLTIDKARVEGCTFRNIGVIDEVPFDEVTNPSGNPKSQGLAEKSGDLYVATSDTSVVAGHTYYAPKGRAVGALRLGDTSNNTENTAMDCVIKGCDFHDVKNNSFYYAPTHSDESNFIKMKGEYVSITHNKFKDLIGYGHDREGVYTKARNCDISYNYIENGGMGEGYICCKDIHNITGHDKYDRIVYIHDNVLVGEGGRGIRTYYGSVIENNTILIKNAKSGIWASGDANTITEIKDNYIALKFDHFYLTDAQSITLYGSDVEPTDYHERTTVIDSILDKATKINGNKIIMWLMLSAAYYAISIQRTYQHVEVNDNRIITNGGSGVNISAVSIQDIQLGDTSVKGLLVDVTGNDIRDNYRPIVINLSGIINSKSKVNIKNNTIWEPTSTACEVLLYDEKVYVLTSDTQVVEDKPYFTYNSTTKVFTPVDNPTGDPKSQGWYEYVDNSNKSTVLTYETTNPNAGFTSRHVRTDCKNVIIDDIAMVEHINPLQK